MSDITHHIDLSAWVARALRDPVLHRQRQAAEITLTAFSMSDALCERVCLKGGVLMGIVYGSPRQTSDIDLTVQGVRDDIDAHIVAPLNAALPRAAAALGYPDLVLAVQTVERQPRKNFENAKYPALKLKIAYATRGTAQEEALRQRSAVNVVEVDMTYFETIVDLDVLLLADGRKLNAYSLTDLIAEKFRALLQQVERNRNRRQDIFDLDRLITGRDFSPEKRIELREAIETKCRSREITASAASMDNPDIKKRAGSDWETLRLEIGDIPDFEGCFSRVSAFYAALPWPR
jgi:hypothetical protein